MQQEAATLSQGSLSLGAVLQRLETETGRDIGWATLQHQLKIVCPDHTEAIDEAAPDTPLDDMPPAIQEKIGAAANAIRAFFMKKGEPPVRSIEELSHRYADTGTPRAESPEASPPAQSGARLAPPKDASESSFALTADERAFLLNPGSVHWSERVRKLRSLKERTGFGMTRLLRLVGNEKQAATLTTLLCQTANIADEYLDERLQFGVASALLKATPHQAELTLEQLYLDLDRLKGEEVPDRWQCARVRAILLAVQNNWKIPEALLPSHAELRVKAPRRKNRVSPERAAAFEALVETAIEKLRVRDTASITLLQQTLCIGHTSAIKVMAELEKRGFVGPKMGTSPRLVRLGEQRISISPKPEPHVNGAHVPAVADAERVNGDLPQAQAVPSSPREGGGKLKVSELVERVAAAVVEALIPVIEQKIDEALRRHRPVEGLTVNDIAKEVSSLLQ